MRLRTLAFLAGCLSLCACSIRVDPAQVATCNLRIIPVETPLPVAHGGSSGTGATESRAPGQAESLADVVAGALTRSGPGGFTTGETPRDMLFLSGGSHDGAYGAGYLLGWAENARPRAALPRFALVTGISTGAILATPAFLGDAQQAYDNYGSIKNESDLLTTYAKMSNGDIKLSSYPSILRHGALADLTPLKAWLRRYLTPETLERVADRGQNQTLLVGVVDVESGKAVAIDLTDLAAKYAEAMDDGDAKAAETARSCYVDAIVASSSAPLAARPVFMNNRTYIDGGVRYAVFSTALQSGVERAVAKLGASRTANPGAPPPKPNVFVLFHGTQTVDPWCEKDMDPALCEQYRDPRVVPSRARTSWSLLGLARRAVGLMVNQLQRVSVTDLEQKYVPVLGKDHFFYTQICPASLDYQATLTVAGQSQTRTCTQWYDYDHVTLEPVQFHPHYMQCLTQAGRARALADRWPSPDAARPQCD